MPNDEKDPVAETSQALEKIEGILSGFLTFSGRFLTTIWYYLLTPSLSAEFSTGGKLHGKVLFPLSFLTTSLLVFSLSYFRLLKELLELNWIRDSIKSMIVRIADYHDSIAETTFALQIADALLLVVPLVLFVGLFAKINELLSILMRRPTTVAQQVNACSYFVGTIVSMLALWSLPILYLIASFQALESLSLAEKISGVLIIALAMGTIVTALFRYLQNGRLQFFGSWILSCAVFSAASVLLVLAIQITLKLLLLGDLSPPSE